jgi:hypothetical protein
MAEIVHETANRRKCLSNLSVESLEKLLISLESYAVDVRDELRRRRVASGADDRERNGVADRRVRILAEARSNVSAGLEALRSLWKDGRR